MFAKYYYSSSDPEYDISGSTYTDCPPVNSYTDISGYEQGKRIILIQEAAVRFSTYGQGKWFLLIQRGQLYGYSLGAIIRVFSGCGQGNRILLIQGAAIRIFSKGKLYRHFRDTAGQPAPTYAFICLRRYEPI